MLFAQVFGDQELRGVIAVKCWLRTFGAMFLGLALTIASLSSSSEAYANGEEWTSVSAPADSAWRSVAYGNGVWIAVGPSAPDPAVNTNRVMRSTDGGLTWSTVSVAQGSWTSVAYGNGVWVAVSSETGDANQVIRSTDGGLSWTAHSAAEANTWLSVAYGNGVWVAVSSDGTNQVMRSTDGLTWSAHGAAAAKDWSRVAYGNGVWVAVSTDDGSGATDRVMRSTNGGVTWTAHAATASNSWISVAYGNDVWIAVSTGGTNRVMRSTNGGVTWTAHAAAEANVWRSVAYGNGVWVAVALSGTNRVMRSTDDGQNWSAIEAAESNSWFALAYGSGVWVAVSTSGTNQVMRSVDPPAPVSQDNEQAGSPGIFLSIGGNPGRLVEGTTVRFGSFSVAPNSSYMLNVQSINSRALTRTVLFEGVTNAGGHAEGRIELGALPAGSYKIVLRGSHAMGYPLVLTNHISVDGAGKFLSVSAEDLQPTLR